MTTTKFTLYRAKDGLRWRAKRGGCIVADSGEAYTRMADLKRSLARFLASIEKGAYSLTRRLT